MATHQLERNLSLDLLRGVCALGIAGFHFLYWGYNIDLQSLALFGVYTFFVLSALALMIRYQEDFETSIRRSTLVEFYWNRVARIIPLLSLMALTSYVYLEWREGNQSLEKAFLTGSGLFALHMPGTLSNTAGAWSLGIELAFYAVFPAVCLLISDFSAKAVAIVLLVFVVAQQMVIGILPDSSLPEFWGQYSMPITFAPFFVSGILIYKTGSSEIPFAMVGWIVCLTAIFLFSAVFDSNLYEGGFPFLFLSILTLFAVFFSYRSTLPSRVWPYARFLGNISYSVYLSHWLVIEVAVRVHNPILRTVVFFAGVVAVASLLYWLFEMPARKWLRSLRSRRSSARLGKA